MMAVHLYGMGVVESSSGEGATLQIQRLGMSTLLSKMEMPLTESTDVYTLVRVCHARNLIVQDSCNSQAIFEQVVSTCFGVNYQLSE